MVDRRFCRRFRHVLVNSKFSKRYTQRIYGYRDDQCRVVYLGVDHDRFRVRDGTQRRLKIVTIAKLTRFKNVDTIIKAIAELVGRGMSDVRLQIVGTGDAEPFLKQMVQKYRLSDNVEFLGRLNDDQIVTLLQQSKVFCLASVDEPFGLVVVESLACGTPVVAINSGGPKEILKDRHCGQLVQPRNEIEVADALQHFLLANEVTFGEATQSAVERAADFQWDKTVDQLEQEFSNIAILSAGTTNDENT
jgi:glycosyltransferase involved in cell wall biosynthesis